MGAGSTADTQAAAQDASRSARPNPSGTGGGHGGPGGGGQGRGDPEGRKQGKAARVANKGGKGGKGGLAGAVVGGSGKAAGKAGGSAAGKALKTANRVRPPVTALGVRRRLQDAAARRIKGLADKGLNGANNSVGQLGNRAQQAGAAAGAKGGKGKADALDPLSTSVKDAGGGAAARGGGKAAGVTARSAVKAGRVARSSARVVNRTVKTIYKVVVPLHIRLIVLVVVIVLVLLLIFLLAAGDMIDQDNADAFDDRDLAELYGLGNMPTVDQVVADTDIPRESAQAYLSAAETYDVDWWVLAGMGFVECTHTLGTDQGCNPDITVDEGDPMLDDIETCDTEPGDFPAPNTSGARGPMQMTGDTWSGDHCQGDTDVSRGPIPEGEENDGTGYASDGDGDGVADPWNSFDATHGTARLLLHRGDGDIWEGVHRYNPGAGTGPDDSWYVDRVRESAEGYRDAVTVTARSAPPMAGGVGGECPANAPESTVGLTGVSQSTDATQRIANAVLECFGGPPGGGNCFDDSAWRNNEFEHPRGRACDLMVCSGCRPTGDNQRWGDAVAAWLVANADELNVLYVIWANESWMASSRTWSPYSTCTSGCDNTSAHYDHVHVSVQSMPGDPGWTRCNGLSKCTENL